MVKREGEKDEIWLRTGEYPTTRSGRAAASTRGGTLRSGLLRENYRNKK